MSLGSILVSKLTSWVVFLKYYTAINMWHLHLFAYNVKAGSDL